MMHDHRRRAGALALTVFILLMVVGVVAIGATTTYTATTGVTYATDSGLSITLGSDQSFESGNPFTAETVTLANTTFRASSGGSMTVDAFGTRGGNGFTNVSNPSAGTSPFFISPTSDSEAVGLAAGESASSLKIPRTINATDETLETDAIVTSASGTTVTLNVSGITGSVEVVNAETGAEIDFDNADGDGVFRFQIPDGTQKLAFQEGPEKLKIYQETNPDELVAGNVTIRVRFFGANGSVIERNASDGTINMTGLPTESRFVVTAGGTKNWTYRRIVIRSLQKTERIYLLNKSKPSAQVVFELKDPTGQFAPEDTILKVEKPLNVNGTTQYQVIAGDTFGATGRFPVILQDGERYRLRVVTENGTQSRILGFYSVYGPTIETLLIQRIEPASDTTSGGVVYGELSNGSVAVRHRDTSQTVDSVTYRILNSSGSVIVTNTTRTADKFADIYQVAVNNSTVTTFTVEYWVDYEDGSERSGSFVVGSVPSIGTRFSIDAQVLSIISWIAILASMGLVVIIEPKLAPIAGTAVASALVIVGTVAIPPPILGVSGAISVLTVFGGSR